jgi:hypothetical protein
MTLVPSMELMESKNGSSVIVTNVYNDDPLELMVGLIMLVGTSYGTLSPEGMLVKVHFMLTMVGSIIYSLTVMSGRFPALLVRAKVALFPVRSGIIPPVSLYE